MDDSRFHIETKSTEDFEIYFVSIQCIFFSLIYQVYLFTKKNLGKVRINWMM